jgi:hypothetical protein
MNSTRGPCLQLIDFYVIYIYIAWFNKTYIVSNRPIVVSIYVSQEAPPRLQVNLLDPPAVDISCTIKIRPRLQSSLFSTNLPSGN